MAKIDEQKENIMNYSHQIKNLRVAVDNLQFLEFCDGILGFKDCQDVFAKIQTPLDSAKQLCTKHKDKGFSIL